MVSIVITLTICNIILAFLYCKSNREVVRMSKLVKHLSQWIEDKDKMLQDAFKRIGYADNHLQEFYQKVKRLEAENRQLKTQNRKEK